MARVAKQPHPDSPAAIRAFARERHPVSPPRLIVISYASSPFNFNDDAIGCLTKEAAVKRWSWCVQGIVALKECGGRGVGLRLQSLSNHVIRSYD